MDDVAVWLIAGMFWCCIYVTWIDPWLQKQKDAAIKRIAGGGKE